MHENTISNVKIHERFFEDTKNGFDSLKLLTDTVESTEGSPSHRFAQFRNLDFRSSGGASRRSSGAQARLRNTIQPCGRDKKRSTHFLLHFRAIPSRHDSDNTNDLEEERLEGMEVREESVFAGIHRGGMSRFSTPIFPRPLPREIA